VKTTISNEQLKENKELNEKLEDVGETMIRAFKAFGSTNYLQLTFSQSNDPDTGYSLRIQKDSGISPAEKCAELEKKIAELEEALLWSRDSNTGFEPSVSVMQRYYDELLPKGGAE